MRYLTIDKVCISERIFISMELDSAGYFYSSGTQIPDSVPPIFDRWNTLITRNASTSRYVRWDDAFKL